MQRLFTEIDIRATAANVWDILMDFQSYPEWNPFIKKIQGTASPGQRLFVQLQLPGKKPMVFKPRVKVLKPAQEFRWLGHFVLPGIFDGEHIFQIESAEQGITRFIQQEEFRGFLVPLFMRSIRTSTLAGFSAMNSALKQRAET